VVVAVALLRILVDDRLLEGYGVAYRLRIAYGDPLFRSGGYDTPKLVRKICEVKGLAEEMAYWWCLHYATVDNHLRAICATQSHFDVAWELPVKFQDRGARQSRVQENRINVTVRPNQSTCERFEISTVGLKYSSLVPAQTMTGNVELGLRQQILPAQQPTLQPV